MLRTVQVRLYQQCFGFGRTFKPSYIRAVVSALSTVFHYGRLKRHMVHSRMFDSSWYYMEYPDVARAGIDPFSHFLIYGAEERRKPAQGQQAGIAIHVQGYARKIQHLFASF